MKHLSRKCVFFLSALVLPIASHPAEALPESVDVVILGGGVGALTSALYLARSGIVPVVIEGKHPGGALSESPKVQNWPGEIEIAGIDLIEKIRNQAQQNGAIFLEEEVVDVDFSQRPFVLHTKELAGEHAPRTVKAVSCVIATGSTPRMLDVPGATEYWTKGLYTCAVCDGSLYKDQVVAVVGGGDAALIEAEYLSTLAKKVYVLVRKDSFRTIEKQREQAVLTASNIEVIYNTEVQEIKGDGEKVTELTLQKSGLPYTSSVSVDALFLALGSTPNSQVFGTQLEVDSKGYILLKKDFETSISGVYAIGDVSDPIFQQAISAAGDGAKAALQAHRFVSKEKHIAAVTVKAAVAEPQPVMQKAVAAPTEMQASKKHQVVKVIEITSAEQLDHEIDSSAVPVLVDFYASWCSPCRHLSPKLDKWAQDLEGKVKILKVNVDKCRDLAKLYQIRSMPTLVVLDNKGHALDRKSGAAEILDYLKLFESEKRK